MIIHFHGTGIFNSTHYVLNGSLLGSKLLWGRHSLPIIVGGFSYHHFCVAVCAVLAIRGLSVALGDTTRWMMDWFGPLGVLLNSL